ncbi:hypothetical protein FN976_11400 [Caenimonas sedimenti]|uniref:Nucleotidyltransferase family protein n=1 Tax=Caenimonas sedimenti TaxID=2596921 RepID=A0A562ZSE2_9BURK|nr:hypothetical protein [Caenimonas sedimenti]TWO71512.1 hypothetical protein FN976_11400 [Caenimonas sedimenti]
MPDEKPQTAAGYNQEFTVACERVMVTLLHGFGTFKNTVRLVGGLVPRYLTPANPPDVPAHVGTSDVDVVLNVQVLADGDAYKTLAQQLKAKGFERATNHAGKPTSWRWLRKVTDHEFVIVEFLRDADENLAPKMVKPVDDENVSAIAFKHVGIVHDWYQAKEVTAELLDGGGMATETVHYADAVAFVVLKTLAYADRAANKDAADLVHVLRYAMPLDELAAKFQDRQNQAQHVAALDAARHALRMRFCDGPGVQGFQRDGCVAASRFALGEEAEADELVLEQRKVSGLVTEFLTLLDKPKF